MLLHGRRSMDTPAAWLDLRKAGPCDGAWKRHGELSVVRGSQQEDQEAGGSPSVDEGGVAFVVHHTEALAASAQRTGWTEPKAPDELQRAKPLARNVVAHPPELRLHEGGVEPSVVGDYNVIPEPVADIARDV